MDPMSSSGLLLPGRDFHFPAKVGDMTPAEMSNFIRWVIQSDPSVLPPVLTVKDVQTTDGTSLVTLGQATGLPTGPGLVFSDSAASGSAVWGLSPGSDNVGIALQRAMAALQGSTQLIGQSFDPIQQNSTRTNTTLNGFLYAALFYVADSATANNIWTWLTTAANWTSATSIVVKAGIYGPLTYANRAAVPLLVGSSSSQTWYTSAGRAPTAMPIGATGLVGGNIYAVASIASWSGTPTVQPIVQTWQPPGSNSTTLSVGSIPNTGQFVSRLIQLSGLTDLPATIDFTAVNSTAINVPWLAVTT